MAFGRQIERFDGGHTTFISFDAKDVEEFAELMKRLPDKIKRKEINKILKDNMQLAKTAVRNATPIRESSRTASKYGATPGNLRDSFVVEISRKKDLGVWLGPKTGRVSGSRTKEQNAKKRDGYYGFWVELGTKHIRGRHFIARTEEIIMPIIIDNIKRKMEQYVIGEANRHLGL